MAVRPSEGQNKDLIRRFFEEVWNDREFDRIDELVASDVTVANPSFEEEAEGPEELRKLVVSVTEAIPDIEVTVHQLVAEVDTVVARWTATGTHEGLFMGHEPSGTKVEVTTVSFITCENGRITRYWALSDVASFRRQIGGA